MAYTEKSNNNKISKSRSDFKEKESVIIIKENSVYLEKQLENVLVWQNLHKDFLIFNEIPAIQIQDSLPEIISETRSLVNNSNSVHSNLASTRQNK